MQRYGKAVVANKIYKMRLLVACCNHATDIYLEDWLFDFRDRYLSISKA